MTYPEFKAKYPAGSTVATPEGTYPGQCVSYVRQYMAQVHGIKTGPLGHAVHFATNPTFLSYYEKVSDKQVGDIIVWGDDPGSWTSEYGHIAIYDGSGLMMNQNYGNSLKISRNRVFTDGLIGFYRRKGNVKPVPKVSLEVARILADGVLGDWTALSGKRDADLEGNHVGKDLNATYIRNLYNSAEAKAFRTRRTSSAASRTLEAIKSLLSK